MAGRPAGGWTDILDFWEHPVLAALSPSSEELDQVKLALAQTKHNLAEATASLNALAQAPAPIQTPEPVDQLTAETEASLANLMQRMDTVLASAAVPQPSETAVETPADTPVGSLADTAAKLLEQCRQLLQLFSREVINRELP